MHQEVHFFMFKYIIASIVFFYYDPSYTIPMREKSKNKNALFRPSSGTQLAYQYAVKKKKILLNLFHNESIMINIFE